MSVDDTHGRNCINRTEVSEAPVLEALGTAYVYITDIFNAETSSWTLVARGVPQITEVPIERHELS